MKSKTWKLTPSSFLRDYIKGYRYLNDVFCGVYRCIPVTDLQIYFSFSSITIHCSQGIKLKNPDIFITGYHDYNQIIGNAATTTVEDLGTDNLVMQFLATGRNPDIIY